jgi:UDP-N-acetylmuramate dehydrogenase
MEALERVGEWLHLYGTPYHQESLAKRTSMHVGGVARWLIEVSSREALTALLDRLVDEGVPWCVLGGGTNTLAADTPLEAVVITPRLARWFVDEGGDVHAECGVFSAVFARQVSDAGYAGWEWGVSLPGMIGGAIVGNAGCFGGETRDGLQWVDVWYPYEGVRRLAFDQLGLAYRTSRFQYEACCVLEGCWRLDRTDDLEVSRQKRAAILAQRKADQPQGVASSGCMFKNRVNLSDETIQEVEARLGVALPEGARRARSIPAGWLIERVGLKGYQEGALRVSEVHANFFAAPPRVTTREILALMERVQMFVFERSGVWLEPEVRMLGPASVLKS